MKIITPVTITDAMLVSSSIPETDEPAWNAATNYAEGARCMRAVAGVHGVFQRLVAGVTATAPENDLTNWQRVGPTSRWAMFDRATGTLSRGTDTISVTIAPGLVRAIALLDLTGTSVTVTMTNGGATVYSRTVGLNAGDGVVDWDTYFFSDIVLKRTAVLTDLPPYSGGQITITLNGSGEVSIGTVAVGTVFEVGGARTGIGLGIIDYSKKTTDDFGTTTLTERAFANRMTVPLILERKRVDEVARRLALLRATPVVFIGTTLFDQSVVYGFYKDWSIDVQHREISYCSMTIEGLS